MRILILSPPAILTVLVLVLRFTWHAILGFLLYSLLILAEVLELALDHLLENVLHLEGHSAQMYTAWIGLGAIIALAVFGYNKASQVFHDNFHSWDSFISSSEAWAKEHWLTLVLPLTVLIISALIF